MSVPDKLLAAVRKDVARDLEEHVLNEEGPGRWFCRRPVVRSEYWFRVIVAPGMVLVYGDIGELILEPSDWDALAWLRGTLKDRCDIDYPLSKVPNDLRRGLEEFSEELAVAEVAEALKDETVTAAQAQELREALEDDDAEASWNQAWSEISSDCEWPGCVAWGRRALYRLEALRWFVDHLPAVLAPAEVSACPV